MEKKPSLTTLCDVSSFSTATGVINSTSIVTGRYDLIIEVFLEPYTVITFLCNDLAKLDSIVSTETFMTLKNYDKWI